LISPVTLFFSVPIAGADRGGAEGPVLEGDSLSYKVDAL